MGTGRREFLVGPGDEGGRAALMCKLDSQAEKLPRLAATVAAAEQRTQVDECPRVLEAGRRVGEHLDRFTKQQLTGLSALDEAERAQRHAQRARRTPGSRERELLAGERSCLFGSPALTPDESREWAPRHVGRVEDLDRLGRVRRLQEVRECALELAGLEAYPASGVEELDVGSDRGGVERASGEGRRGVVAVA